MGVPFVFRISFTSRKRRPGAFGLPLFQRRHHQTRNAFLLKTIKTQATRYTRNGREARATGMLRLRCHETPGRGGVSCQETRAQPTAVAVASTAAARVCVVCSGRAGGCGRTSCSFCSHSSSSRFSWTRQAAGGCKKRAMSSQQNAPMFNVKGPLLCLLAAAEIIVDLSAWRCHVTVRRILTPSP